MIDIWRRNCPCCGNVTSGMSGLYTINIGTKSVEICLDCMKDLHDQLGEVIASEQR